MELKHQYAWLQIVDGEVRCEPGFKTPTVMRFAADPQLTREEWREGIEIIATMFTQPQALERIDRSVAYTARPGLPQRAVQMIDVDDGSGVLRAVPSLGELATISRLNVIIDAHALVAGGDQVRVVGAKRVLQLLDQLSNWLRHAPDPLPNILQPEPKKPKAHGDQKLGERVAALETRVDEALAVPTASPMFRH